MDWQRLPDPAALAAFAGAHLREAPLFNQFALGLMAPGADLSRYPDLRLYAVTDGGRCVGVVTHTPPWRPALSRMSPAAAACAGANLAPCGEVFGEEEAALAFAHASAGGAPTRVVARMGLFELREVQAVGPSPGTMRVADEADAALLQAWVAAFRDEAVPHDPAPGPEDGLRLARSGRSRFWEHQGAVVAWAHSAREVDGRWASIGPVYTPPHARGRGWATHLVAAYSAALLAEGRVGCTLYTDLDNPTSNAIYERIGYRRIGTMCRVCTIDPRA